MDYKKLVYTEKVNDQKLNVFYENGVNIGEFIKGDDGYYIYFPVENGGAWSESVLYALAQHLEELNKEWHNELMNRPEETELMRETAERWVMKNTSLEGAHVMADGEVYLNGIYQGTVYARINMEDFVMVPSTQCGIQGLVSK